jgi:hypothetical protein
MRDSNPRGLAPNPLSKSARRCSGWSAGRGCGGRDAAGALGEHRRTVATETKTETGVPPSRSSDTRLRGPRLVRPARRPHRQVTADSPGTVANETTTEARGQGFSGGRTPVSWSRPRRSDQGDCAGVRELEEDGEGGAGSRRAAAACEGRRMGRLLISSSHGSAG